MDSHISIDYRDLDYKLVLNFVEAYCEKVKEIKEQIEKSESNYPLLWQALSALNSDSSEKTKLEEGALALKIKMEELGELHNSVSLIKFATADLTIRRVKLGDCHV